MRKEEARTFIVVTCYLSSEENTFLFNFLGFLDDHSRTEFRKNIVEMYKQEIGENQDENLTMLFLRMLIKTVKEDGYEEAKRLCLAFGIIKRKHPLKEKENEENISWLRDRILDFFEVSSVEKLKEKGIVERLNFVIEKASRPWDKYLEGREKRHWLKRLFWA